MNSPFQLKRPQIRNFTLAGAQSWSQVKIGKSVKEVQPFSTDNGRLALCDGTWVPDVFNFEGDVRYVDVVLKQELAKGYDLEVHVVVHSVRKVGDVHQVLYTSVNMTDWMRICHYLSGGADAAPLYLLLGLAAARVKPGRVLVICAESFVYLYSMQDGRLVRESRQVNSDNIELSVRAAVMEAVAAARMRTDGDVSKVDILDVRAPGTAKALQFDSLGGEGVSCRIYDMWGEANRRNETHKYAAELLRRAQPGAICNPRQGQLDVYLKEHWWFFQAFLYVVLALSAVVLCVAMYSAFNSYRQYKELSLREKDLASQIEQLKNTANVRDIGPQKAFLEAVAKASYQTRGSIADALGAIKAVQPNGLNVIGFSLAPAKAGVSPLSQKPHFALHLIVDEVIVDKRGLINTFELALQARGFQVETNATASPNPGGSNGVHMLEIHGIE
jgi:hypothetical protein